MLIIPKYYCPHCRNFRSRFDVRWKFGYYNSKNFGGAVEGSLLCCDACDNPVVDVHQRIMHVVEGMCRESDYKDVR